MSRLESEFDAVLITYKTWMACVTRLSELEKLYDTGIARNFLLWPSSVHDNVFTIFTVLDKIHLQDALTNIIRDAYTDMQQTHNRYLEALKKFNATQWDSQ